MFLGIRYRGDKFAYRRFRRLYYFMVVDFGEFDSLMVSIMDAFIICFDCGESFSSGVVFL